MPTALRKRPKVPASAAAFPPSASNAQESGPPWGPIRRHGGGA